MDSLTQMALGAAVGSAVAGRRYGRKAALIGAVVGTLPDLDIFIPLGDPVSNFTYHRGFSHSIVFCVLATPVLAYLISKMKWFQADFRDKTLHLKLLLILLTHILLDALTIYGTQIFWPLPVPPLGAGSIFIIDPLYTLPILAGLAGFLIFKSPRTNKLMLLATTLYLLWGLGAQLYVSKIAAAGFETPPQKMLVQTTPFNSLLWRILIMEESQYKVGYYSVFDDSKEIKYKTYPNAPALLEPIEDSFAVQRLKWFSKGFYSAEEQGGKIIMRDLRMGLEPDQYVFSFVVGQIQSGQVSEIPNHSVPGERDMSRLATLRARIWDEQVEMPAGSCTEEGDPVLLCAR